ncbi:MAG: 50S ribosomal protein L19 [candidate division WOR-3 bacterium]
MEEIIHKVEEEYKRKDLPEIKPGDTVKVYWKILEIKEDPKKKTRDVKMRTQVFEGVVLALQGKGINKKILVRKISYGIPVERLFPLHSPYLEKLEIVSRAKVRRAKLYYLRDKIGKAAKLKVLREENQG